MLSLGDSEANLQLQITCSREIVAQNFIARIDQNQSLSGHYKNTPKKAQPPQPLSFLASQDAQRSTARHANASACHVFHTSHRQ